MPYKDPIKYKEAMKKRQEKYRQRIHDERFGIGSGNMRGRHGNNLKGPDHPRWNHGKLISSHGYVLIRVPKDHPLAFGAGYAYEHDLVMYEKTGRLPDADWVVHHKDTNTQHNEYENLEWKKRFKHNADHNSKRDRDHLGRFLAKAAGRMLDGKIHDELPWRIETAIGKERKIEPA